ncbi:hypothetical protein [Methylobacillus glycogenes]|uniref:hypothetical protein n=1 Tax=Methylobacillus glycogenes TaxID=406 RepID=UPI00046E9CB3|nr:hypothetical protein [Methylobacillus glycogenes]
MIESLIYKNMKIEVRGAKLAFAGFTYSVHIGDVEHSPSVVPLESWDLAKLEGIQYGMKLVDQVMDSFLPATALQ